MRSLGLAFIIIYAVGLLAACGASREPSRVELLSAENQVCLSLKDGQNYFASKKPIDYDSGVLRVGQAEIHVYAGWQPPVEGRVREQDVTNSSEFVFIRRIEANGHSQVLWARKYKGHIGNLYVLFSGPSATFNPQIVEKKGFVQTCGTR